MIRIGHRGAAALAPENTLASIERALEVGVDMVEVDVLALADGTLVLAHSDDLLEVSHGAAAGTVVDKTLERLRRDCPALPTLDEALALVAGSGAGVQLDVKWPGYEAGVVEAVRRRGLEERTLVSSCFRSVLVEVAERGPPIRRGLTYPFDRRGVSQRRSAAPLVPVGLAALRRLLPPRIGRMLGRARAETAVLHHLVVSRAAVERCHARGASVLAWTVDDPAAMRRLAAQGVDGIITNDPRLFAATV